MALIDTSLANTVVSGVNAFDTAVNFAEGNTSFGNLLDAAAGVIDAVAKWKTGDNPNDWRVRLSIPAEYGGSSVLQPLIEAGGMVFPYTPTVSIGNSASYSPIHPTHSNFAFNAYRYSDVADISIEAPMNVDTEEQAAYYVAALLYMRTITKMFTGSSPAGNPPPIVALNGYGAHVFKDVPVVVTSFGTSFNSDCDYIPVKIAGSLAGEIASGASAVSSLASGIGSASSMLSGFAGAISTGADFVSTGAQIASRLGLDLKTAGEYTYVPTSSKFSVKLKVAYSRASALNFNLNQFVTGGYITNQFGYV